MHLRRTDLALKVLGDRPKYGIDLPALSDARDLLHNIWYQTRFQDPKSFTGSMYEDGLLLAALYPRYGLGNALDDPVSAMILVPLCLHHKKPVSTAALEPMSMAQQILKHLESKPAHWKALKSANKRHQGYIQSILELDNLRKYLKKWSVELGISTGAPKKGAAI